ncbi:MAG TPA: ATP-binding protein [Sumerlaeia bacterium]|nr:ATP-binding protein [Sumerlaeia bacterium]
MSVSTKRRRPPPPEANPGGPVSPGEVPAGASTGRISPEAVSQLQEAFRIFNEASLRFGDHYARLEKRIAELNLEIEEANARLRENLREKQRVQDYLSTLLESLPIGVIGADPGGRVTSCNRRAAEITGLAAEKIHGRRLTEALGALGAAQAAGASLEEVERAIVSGSTGQGPLELVFERARDQRRRTLRLRVVPTDSNPHEAESGTARGARVVLLEDVTDIRRLEQQANRKKRLTAMGEIAMNVAHEIRNPLGSIELFASMLKRELAGDPACASLAGHICTGVRCVDHIVANILQFARPQRLSCSTLNLNELIDETLLFAEHALAQKRIRVERDYRSPRAAFLWADADLLKQMFLNLFLNAIQATPEGGAIGVHSLPNGATIEVQVWDTGCGLAPDVIGRIFDPFFTTRRKGTGLGLTIAHNIVSAHQGNIEADNRPEQGAVFSIVLPKKAPSRLDGSELASSLSDPAADGPLPSAAQDEESADAPPDSRGG